MTRCTLALAALLLILASTTTAFVRPPLSPPPLALLHATEPTRDVFTASLFEDKASDPLRQDGYWEELFMKGSSGAVPSEASRVSLLKESTTPPPEGEGVEVVSFDLDDTLWCGKTVINNANKYVWVDGCVWRACWRWEAHLLLLLPFRCKFIPSHAQIEEMCTFILPHPLSIV